MTTGPADDKTEMERVVLMDAEAAMMASAGPKDTIATPPVGTAAGMMASSGTPSPAEPKGEPPKPTESPVTRYLCEKLERMFPGEVRKRAAPAASNLMNSGMTESLEHVVNAVIETDFVPEDFDAFVKERGYLAKSLGVLADGKVYYGMPIEQVDAILASEANLLRRTEGLVVSQDALFERKNGSRSVSQYIGYAMKGIASLAALGGIMYVNGKYNMPLPTTAGEAFLAAVGGWKLTDVLAGMVDKLSRDASRSGKNRRLAAGYGPIVEAAIESHYQNLLKLRDALDIKVNEGDAEKSLNPLSEGYKPEPFDEAKVREELRKDYASRALDPADAKLDKLVEADLKTRRKEHADEQRRGGIERKADAASLRRALHLYEKLDRQLEAFEQLRRYMGDETSSYAARK